jgi:hypothetical protein
MSCFSNSYNPVPAREWTRYKPNCTQNVVISGDIYNLEINNKIPNYIKYNLDVYKKGNILQYKKNSSELTKNQRYSMIVKGSWVNGKKVWATQTEQYTNPNIKSLKRDNSDYYPITNNIINGAIVNTSIVNINCPPVPAMNNYNVLPPISSTNKSNPIIPPKPTNTSNNNVVMPNTLINYPTVNEEIIVDGGTLLCNTRVNPCTNEVTNKTFSNDCYPTTCSDVPGPSTILCWNDGLTTYYPKTKLTYGNSNNKWPVNVKLKAA